MTGIKTLADEIRETIRLGADAEINPEKEVKKEAKKKERKSNSAPNADGSLEMLINEIRLHQLNGKEKLLIRLDDKTVFFLKQLKVTKGIDMNKIISFSLQSFLKNNPALRKYIKESLNTIEL